MKRLKKSTKEMKKDFGIFNLMFLNEEHLK